MLVLTRKSKEKISFPQLGITVHFIRVQSGQVKVGVDAPREIVILRDEIREPSASDSLLERQLSCLPKEIRHSIRNDLHEVSVGLHLYKELVSANMHSEASEVFGDIQEALKRVDSNEALNAPSDRGTAPSSSTVVVVEDQSNEREMLAGILRLRKMDVVTLCNGEELVNYFHENPAPGYVILDMQMPVCDGPTAVAKLQDEQLLSETQVFAVSGMSPEVYGLTVGEGVERWFPKPLNPVHLLDAMPSG